MKDWYERNKKLLFLCISFLFSLLAFFEWPKGQDLSAHEYLRSLTYVVAAWGAIASTVISTWNSLDVIKKEETNKNFTKTENSFRFVERWETPLLKEARRYTRNVRDERTAMCDRDLLEKIKADDKLRESIICTYNFWEEMYLSIKHDRVVESILKDTFSEIFCNMYTRFSPWRESEMKTHNSKGYENITALYKKWFKDDKSI
ncbi:MAG: hypothetical protein AB9872_12950 [Solidesulfovibrio sp.]